MLPLVLVLLAADPPPLAGTFVGDIRVRGIIPLQFVFTFEAGKDGKLGGTMRSPDLDDRVARLGDVSLSGNKVDARVPSTATGRLVGTLSADGKAIKGEWRQAGQNHPIELIRTDKPFERLRPQLPKGPFPYRAEEVKFQNPQGGHALAGTLTVPAGAGPFPAAVLVSGSGPQDRDESLMGHKPFWVLADYLSRRGVAVLRYDDRGVGKSGGQFVGSTSADFATDAHAAVRFLLTRPGIDPKRVGIVGHSEGGIIGPLVAAAHPADIGFLVLLAGPGLPGDVVGRTQVRDMLRAEGKDEKFIAGMVAMNALSVAALKKPWVDPRPVLAGAAGGLAAAAKDKWQPKPLGDPWLRFFIQHDPRPTLAKVTCPVLALNGSKDMQVAATDNLQAIKGACPQAEVKALPGLNHLFQPCETGMLGEYGRIETTLDPSLLDAVAGWVLAVRPKAAP